MSETTGIIILLICHFLQVVIISRMTTLFLRQHWKDIDSATQAESNVLRLNSSHNTLRLKVTQLTTENAGLKQANINANISISKYKKEVTGLEQQIRHLENQVSLLKQRSGV